MYELTFHLLTLVNFGALFGDETRVRTIQHVFVAFLWVKLSKAQCTYISLTLSYKNALRINTQKRLIYFPQTRIEPGILRTTDRWIEGGCTKIYISCTNIYQLHKWLETRAKRREESNTLSAKPFVKSFKCVFNLKSFRWITGSKYATLI